MANAALSYGTAINRRFNLSGVRKPRSFPKVGELMVTVLVEKREFGEKFESASRPRRNVKPAAKAAASQPPAATPPVADPSSRDELSPSDRYRQISVFAYYKAERRGFTPGHMWDDWLAAEREVDAGSIGGSLQASDPGRSGGS
jgi:hypothetical protein